MSHLLRGSICVILLVFLFMAAPCPAEDDKSGTVPITRDTTASPSAGLGERRQPEDDFDADPVGLADAVLKITDKNGHGIQKVFLRWATSARDNKTPGKLKCFATPTIDLCLNPEPLSGWPAQVFAVRKDGKSTVLTFRLRLYPKKLEEAAIACLQGEESSFIKEATKKNGGKSIAIKLEEYPITWLGIDVHDVIAPEVSLAFRQENVHKADEYCDFPLSFSPEQLSLFRAGWQEKGIVFAPVYQYRGQERAYGVQHTSVEYSVKLAVEKVLEHEQIDDKMPIFKSQADDVLRQAAVAVIREVHIDDPRAATQFKSVVPSLAGQILSAPTQMTWSEITQAYPSFDEQALAKGLTPLVQTLVDGKTTMGQKSRTEGNEHVTVISTGAGLSIPVFGANVTHEERQRFLKAIQDLSAWELRYDETKQRYQPVRAEIRKLAKGWDAKRFYELERVSVALSSVKSIVVSDTPSPQTFTADVVDASLERTISRARQAERRERDKQATLEKSLADLLAKIDEAKQDAEYKKEQLKQQMQELVQINQETDGVKKAVKQLAQSWNEIETQRVDAAVRRQQINGRPTEIADQWTRTIRSSSSVQVWDLAGKWKAAADAQFASDVAKLEAELSSITARQDEVKRSLDEKCKERDQLESGAETMRKAILASRQAKEKAEKDVNRMTRQLEKLDNHQN